MGLYLPNAGRRLPALQWRNIRANCSKNNGQVIDYFDKVQKSEGEKMVQASARASVKFIDAEAFITNYVLDENKVCLSDSLFLFYNI